jgi:hypothetical protein
MISASIVEFSAAGDQLSAFSKHRFTFSAQRQENVWILALQAES